MAKDSVIRSLTKQEQELLALCGITQDDQLAQIGPHALFQEIEAASLLFSDAESEQLELTRLEYICQQAANSIQMSSAEATTLWQDRGERSLPGRTAALPSGSATPSTRRYSTATGRVLVNHEAKKAEALDEAHKKSDPRDFSHAITCAHPVAIYLGAWFTVFFYLSVIMLALGVTGLLIGIEYPREFALPVVAAVLFGTVGYALMLSSALCSTCRISVFSLRRYPRHRKAHHLPLLGHTFATALYVIFFFRFRCPSCGTPQKLFGRRRRNRRSSGRR